MINENSILVAVGTCKKYHNTRLKYQTNTMFKNIKKQNIVIFSDFQQNINGYNTLLSNKTRQFTNFCFLNYFYNTDYEYVIVCPDDTYFNLNIVIDKLNTLDLFKPIYAGYPLYHLDSIHSFVNGFLSGGNICIFNRLCIQKIHKYLNIDIARTLPGIKSGTDSYFCQDVMLGVMCLVQNIIPINIFSKEIPYSYIGILNIGQMIKLVNKNPQVGYHFIDHMITNNQQMQNKYLNYMMNYLYKNNL